MTAKDIIKSALAAYGAYKLFAQDGDDASQNDKMPFAIRPSSDDEVTYVFRVKIDKDKYVSTTFPGEGAGATEKIDVNEIKEVEAGDPINASAEDEAVAMDAGANDLAAARRKCEATIEQCRAKNKMSCPYHGPQIVKSDILAHFQQLGINEIPEVIAEKDQKGRAKGSYIIKVPCMDTPDRRKAVEDAINSFLRRPGIDQQSIGDAEYDFIDNIHEDDEPDENGNVPDKQSGYLSLFDVDALNPNAGKDVEEHEDKEPEPVVEAGANEAKAEPVRVEGEKAEEENEDRDDEVAEQKPEDDRPARDVHPAVLAIADRLMRDNDIAGAFADKNDLTNALLDIKDTEPERLSAKNRLLRAYLNNVIAPEELEAMYNARADEAVPQQRADEIIDEVGQIEDPVVAFNPVGLRGILGGVRNAEEAFKLRDEIKDAIDKGKVPEDQKKTYLDLLNAIEQAYGVKHEEEKVDDVIHEIPEDAFTDDMANQLNFEKGRAFAEGTDRAKARGMALSSALGKANGIAGGANMKQVHDRIHAMMDKAVRKGDAEAHAGYEDALKIIGEKAGFTPNRHDPSKVEPYKFDWASIKHNGDGTISDSEKEAIRNLLERANIAAWGKGNDSDKDADVAKAHALAHFLSKNGGIEGGIGKADLVRRIKERLALKTGKAHKGTRDAADEMANIFGNRYFQEGVGAFMGGLHQGDGIDHADPVLEGGIEKPAEPVAAKKERKAAAKDPAVAAQRPRRRKAARDIVQEALNNGAAADDARKPSENELNDAIDIIRRKEPQFGDEINRAMNELVNKDNPDFGWLNGLGIDKEAAINMVAERIGENHQVARYIRNKFGVKKPDDVAIPEANRQRNNAGNGMSARKQTTKGQGFVLPKELEKRQKEGAVADSAKGADMLKQEIVNFRHYGTPKFITDEAVRRGFQVSDEALDKKKYYDPKGATNNCYKQFAGSILTNFGIKCVPIHERSDEEGLRFYKGISDFYESMDPSNTEQVKQTISNLTQSGENGTVIYFGNLHADGAILKNGKWYTFDQLYMHMGMDKTYGRELPQSMVAGYVRRANGVGYGIKPCIIRPTDGIAPIMWDMVVPHNG